MISGRNRKRSDFSHKEPVEGLFWLSTHVAKSLR